MFKIIIPVLPFFLMIVIIAHEALDSKAAEHFCDESKVFDIAHVRSFTKRKVTALPLWEILVSPCSEKELRKNLLVHVKAILACYVINTFADSKLVTFPIRQWNQLKNGFVIEGLD
jgi:hypothetical protein